MSSIAARRADKRACPLQPNRLLSRGTYGILAQMPLAPLGPRATRAAASRVGGAAVPGPGAVGGAAQGHQGCGTPARSPCAQRSAPGGPRLAPTAGRPAAPRAPPQPLALGLQRGPAAPRPTPRVAAAPRAGDPGQTRTRPAAAPRLPPAPAAPGGPRPPRPARSPAGRAPPPRRPRRARAARRPPAGPATAGQEAPAQPPRPRGPGLAAPDRHGEARGRAGCAAPARRARHRPEADRRAGPGRPHGGGGAGAGGVSRSHRAPGGGGVKPSTASGSVDRVRVGGASPGGGGRPGVAPGRDTLTKSQRSAHRARGSYTRGETRARPSPPRLERGQLTGFWGRRYSPQRWGTRPSAPARCREPGGGPRRSRLYARWGPAAAPMAPRGASQTTP